VAQALTDPASNEDSFAEDSPLVDGAGEDELDQLLAEVSLKTAALQQEVAGDSAGASGGGQSPESDFPALADQKTDVEVQIADVEALVAAAKDDVGAELPQDASPDGNTSSPLNESQETGVASVDSLVSPDPPAEYGPGSSVTMSSEYTDDTPETTSSEAETDTPDDPEIAEESHAGRLAVLSVWGRTLLLMCLNLLDMVDRRTGWLASGPRRILGFAAVATFVAAVALLIVSFVISPDVPI